MENYMKYNLETGMIDSHFHILEMNRKGLPTDELLVEYEQRGISLLLDAGVDLDSFERRLEYRQYHKGLYFAAGIHPNISRDHWPEDRDSQLMKQASHPAVKAVGETGLDFFRTTSNRQDQMELLELQYDISLQVEKPLIFHCREADTALEKWMNQLDFPYGGVLHCFPGGRKLGETALEKGLMISFAGNFTFKNAPDIREAVSWVPLERVLIETDAPYLSPVPLRGRENHPGHIGHTYEAVAREYDIPKSQLMRQVEDNFKKFLNL